MARPAKSSDGHPGDEGRLWLSVWSSRALNLNTIPARFCGTSGAVRAASATSDTDSNGTRTMTSPVASQDS